jgi:hypothetical protein
MDWFFHSFDACLLALAQGACWAEALFVISTCAPLIAPLFIRCFCCTLACTILTDNYGSNTIANYDQRDGTWSIGSGVLSTSSTTGLIIHNTTTRDNTGQVIVSINELNTGEIAGVVGAYVDDDNYLLAELECLDDGIGDWAVRLIERVGGVETTLDELSGTILNFGATHGVWLCWTGTYASVRLDGSPSTHIFWESSLVGNKVGIKVTNNTGTLNFDGFNIQDSFDNVATCQECDAHCASHCIGNTSSRQIQVDIAGMASGTCGDCTVLNTTHILDLRRPGSTHDCGWNMSLPDIGSCGPITLVYAMLITSNRLIVNGTGCQLTVATSGNLDCSGPAGNPAMSTEFGGPCTGCDASAATATFTPL